VSLEHLVQQGGHQLTLSARDHSVLKTVDLTEHERALQVQDLAGSRVTGQRVSVRRRLDRVEFGGDRSRQHRGFAAVAHARAACPPGRHIAGPGERKQRRELAEQGKDPATFPIGKRVYLIVDDDASRARERVVAGLHRIYGQMPGIEDVPVSGTPDDVVRGIREVIDAGAPRRCCSTRSGRKSPRTASRWNGLPQR
jgi:hypothetical protein